MKRRENDKKILALYGEMKDMMAVLTQYVFQQSERLIRVEIVFRLGNMADVEKCAPDGSSIKGRIQILCKTVATDIRACSNACDTYSRTKIYVKILSGPLWDGKLTGFVATFTKRRNEFEFALSIHTAVTIDGVSQTLGDVAKTTQETNERCVAVTSNIHSIIHNLLRKGRSPLESLREAYVSRTAEYAKLSKGEGWNRGGQE